MCLFFLFLFESFFSLNQVLKKKDYFILEYFEKEIYARNIFSIRRKFGRTWKSSFKIDQLFYFSPREKEISIKEEETSQDWNGVYIYIYNVVSREIWLSVSAKKFDKMRGKIHKIHPNVPAFNLNYHRISARLNFIPF